MFCQQKTGKNRPTTELKKLNSQSMNHDRLGENKILRKNLTEVKRKTAERKGRKWKRKQKSTKTETEEKILS